MAQSRERERERVDNSAENISSRDSQKGIGRAAILSETSKSDTQIAEIGVSSTELIEQAGQYLTSEMVSEIQDRMTAIVDIMERQIIGEKPQDMLTLQEKRNLACVNDSGMEESALSFTSEEIGAVASFARTDSAVIEQNKIERIHDVISKSINGVRTRRDYYPFNSEKGERLLDLNGKFEQWERGGKWRFFV